MRLTRRFTMKKRFLLLLCALLALPVFASAEDVLTLSGAALNAAQTIAADDSLIITETITDEEGFSNHNFPSSSPKISPLLTSIILSSPKLPPRIL